MSEGGWGRLLPRIALLAAVVLLASRAGAGTQPYTEAGGALDGTALRQSHAGNLEAAGSFTSPFDVSYAAGEDRTTIDLTTWVDGEADRALRRSRLNASGGVSGVLRTTVHTDGITTYQRRTLETGDGTTSRYGSDTAPYGGSVRPVDTAAARFAGAFGGIDRVNWTQAGVERYDGTAVTRYEAGGLGAFLDAGSVAVPGADTDAAPEEPAGPDETTDARATLLATEDGTVGLPEVTFVAGAGDGRTTVDYRLGFEAIGSMTVEEPARTDRAAGGQQAAVR